MIKKILVILFLLLSNNALAKTSGDYLGISLIRSDVEAGNYVDTTGKSLNNVFANNIRDDDRYSFGLNYKYAINFGGFFVAPGVFYDHNDISAADNLGQRWKLNNRLGVRFDGGYDLSDNFAGYGFTGFSVNGLEVANNITSSNGTVTEPFLGFGVKYSILDIVDLSLEYEFSRYKADVKFVNNVEADQEFDLNVIRFGVSFGF